MTCGKFYASFLIQDYFKKYRKRKERERKSKRKDRAASLQVTLKERCVGFEGIESAHRRPPEVGHTTHSQRGRSHSDIPTLTIQP